MVDLLSRLYADEPAGFFYFHGPNGTGKSIILMAAVNDAINQGRTGFYAKTSDIMKILRTAVMDNPREEAEALYKLKNVTVLCMDEMMRQRDTDYSQEALFDLLDDRHQSSHEYNIHNPAKLTLIASNYYPSKLQKYFLDRLYSRNSLIVDTSKVPDYRKEEDKAKFAPTKT